MLKSPKVTTEGGLCNGFMMVSTQGTVPTWAGKKYQSLDTGYYDILPSS